MKFVISFVVTLLFSISGFSWGGRGHHMICETASFLVQEPGLKDFLRTRPQVMGHLCNVPDTQWRNGPAEQTQAGNSAHYVDIETLQSELGKFSSDYKALIAKHSGQKNQATGEVIKDLHKELGSNWWRALQFYQRAVAEKSGMNQAPDEKAKEDTYGNAVFNFFVNLGVMGHFVGDNAQPLHLTVDYDGWKSGHGGLHSFYEEAVVGAIGLELNQAVQKEALKLRNAKWLVQGSVFDRMRELGKLSFADLPTLFKLDKVLEPSQLKEEKGMQLKTPAKRKTAEAAAKDYQALITKHLARASALLAQFWDEAYREAGKPDLSSYKSYRYPTTVDFVFPEYLK